MDLDFIESALPTIPREHLKSSTVETLIAQNEDLMIKFKTALRRLSTLEEQNQQILEEQMELKRQNSILHDQVSVLKDKDQSWKSKVEQIETDRLLFLEKNSHLSHQLKIQSLEILRFQKYQEKIKTQVKPYLNQLKKYAGSLEEKTRDNLNSIVQKDGLIHDLRIQIVELAKNSQIQSMSQEQRLLSTVESYEKSVRELSLESDSYKARLDEAETRIIKFHKIQEKLDRLENDHIELQRSRDQIKQQLESEVFRLQGLHNETHRLKSKFESENRGLNEKLEQVTQDSERLRVSQRELVQQLESLRYLHGQKTEENEKLTISIHSLERLNLELSRKIHEVRLASESCDSSTA
jgi:chromosome segregation ATPase